MMIGGSPKRAMRPSSRCSIRALAGLVLLTVPPRWGSILRRSIVG